MKAVAAWMCALLVLLVTTQVTAQDEQQAEDEPGEVNASGADEPSAGQNKPGADARNWSFGPYFRFVVVPSFMLKLFLDEAPSPSNVAFGASAAYRTAEGGPIFDMGLGYTSYGFTGPFRAKGGIGNDTEIVESNLGLVHLTGSILWESKIVEKLAFQYGVGLDLGIVTGSMKRTEAFPSGSGWAKCLGPGNPPLAAAYCQPPLTASGILAGSDPYNVKGEQYGVTQKNIPPVMAFPMLPRLGLQYAPIPDFWVRLDAAYGIAQFWFGLSAAYVPKM
jgi:hypothetical protein